MASASFTHFLKDQIINIKTCGFVLIRCNKVQSPICTANLNALKNEIWSDFQADRSTFRYKFWRFFNQVSTSDNRHSVPLPLTAASRIVLNDALGSVRHCLNGVLDIDSPLVELSSIISLPGSLQQDTHADTPFSTAPSIYTVFVALSEIKLQNGPTWIHPKSHTKASHDKYATNESDIYYSSDGVQDDPVSRNFFDSNSQLLPAEYALLNQGDILIFDSRLFHFGGANVSLDPRILMCIAFQQRDQTGSSDRIKGYTYHCHDTVHHAALQLKDFPAH